MVVHAQINMQMKALQLYYYLQAKLFLNTYKNFNLLSVKMAPSKKEAQQKTILHFWEQGIRNAAEIHSKTKIPLRTIYNNLKKLKESGDIKRKSGSGRTKKITPRASRSIGQLIRRQPTISTKSIASKLKDVGVDVSRFTVSRHLVSFGYKNALPLSTPMLTQAHKQNVLNGPKNIRMIIGERLYLVTKLPFNYSVIQ